MGRLDGTSAVVTGGASGLGRAIVERFVAEGARVVVLDRSKVRLDELSKELGDAVRTIAGDVRSFEDNSRACAIAEREFGGLDAFIGNAGIWDFGRSLIDTPAHVLADAFDELFAVNVKGYLLGAKAAVEPLRKSNGTLILTLSNAAFFPAGGGPLYTASKHAALGLVRQLAYELAPEVRVNAVAPGGLATDLRGPGALGLADTSITDELPIDTILREHSALRTAPEPADCTSPYVLLASKEARTFTGTVIDISTFGTPPRRQ
ncbi:3-(cis-5,6-dihydroxycyclohexa-1,3-dien-1-yl)propanoate dehydrogenase [Streptomyces sp. NPDC101152]|uniref:3-(cis-5,6-dihydroxycyclohexa-1, 3-dien-1-yl)propanoate dehydrogenase n=1 Tax=Streptomyces sp. NPDC101152 TaxID=3366116 RepID=UPI003820649B